jgi:hypothetical protein
MDSYKRSNENLHAVNERHALPSGENFVLSPVIYLQYRKFSTKFLTKIRRNSLNSYAVYISNYAKAAIYALEHHIHATTQCLEHNPQHFQKQTIAHVTACGR